MPYKLFPLKSEVRYYENIFYLLKLVPELGFD
jgi:hypothetical protein